MSEEKITKKELLLNCTMQTVSKNGMLSFSMKTVTDMAGTAEGLIYKHFQTKENLLLQCYLYIYKEIRDCIENDDAEPELKSKEDVFVYLRNLWKKYFDYLMQNPIKTLFIYEYRASAYMKSATVNGDISPRNYFKKTTNLFYDLDKKFNILNKIDLKYLFVCIVDVTTVFAMRIINEEVSCDEAMYDNIWNLIWNGESWLLND